MTTIHHRLCLGIDLLNNIILLDTMTDNVRVSKYLIFPRFSLILVTVFLFVMVLAIYIYRYIYIKFCEWASVYQFVTLE